MESVEVHCDGDASLQLSFTDGRVESLSSNTVAKSGTLSNLMASAVGGQGDMMHVPKGYLQAWLEHVRSEMQCPASETDVESLMFLLKASDFLADEVSISAICTELGHRVFDVSNIHNFQSSRGDPGSASMTTMPSAEGTGSQETLNPQTDSVDASQSSAFSSVSMLRNTHVVPGVQTSTITDNEANYPVSRPLPMHCGEQIISQLPSHLAVSVIQAADAGLGVCLTVLPATYHPLALCAHFPSITRDRSLCIARDSFKTPPNARVLQSLFNAAATFTNLRTLQISPSNSDSVTDDVVASFENALAQMTLLATLQVDDNFLTDNVANAVAQAIPHLPHLSSLSLKAPIFWPRLRLARRQALQEALQHCPGLKHLSLSTIYGYCEENEDKDGTSALASALVNMTGLEALALTAGSVNSGSLQALQALLPKAGASWLPCMQHIRELNLSSNTSLRDDGAKILAPILAGLVNLETLDISWNGICPEGAEALAPSFQNLTNLRFINVSFNDLYDQGVTALAAAWANLHSLEHLNMNMCSASAPGCVQLAEALTRFSKLSHLDLSRCLLSGGVMAGGVDDSLGARALAEALRGHGSLRHLDLFGSGLNAEVMSHMAPCIAMHTGLTCLDLRDRTMSATGVVALSQRITTLKNLEVFSLCCLDASVEASNALASALPPLKNLRALDLTHFHSTPDGTLNLVEALSSIRSLERMDLSFCELSSSAAMSLAPGLRSMTNLEVLHLNGNPIGDEGMAALAPAMAPLISLKHVSFADTQITARGASAIVGVFDGRDNIERVVLMMNGFDRTSLSENLRKSWLIC